MPNPITMYKLITVVVTVGTYYYQYCISIYMYIQLHDLCMYTCTYHFKIAILKEQLAPVTATIQVEKKKQAIFYNGD